MSNSPFAHENSPASAYGEFDTYGTHDWTEADWAEYDAHIADEILAFDAINVDDVADFYLDPDAEPPF